MRRGKLSREDILKRIALQMPDDEKRELATFVIFNDDDEEHLKKEIDKLYSEIIG